MIIRLFTTFGKSIGSPPPHTWAPAAEVATIYCEMDKKRHLLLVHRIFNSIQSDWQSNHHLRMKLMHIMDFVALFIMNNRGFLFRWLGAVRSNRNTKFELSKWMVGLIDDIDCVGASHILYTKKQQSIKRPYRLIEWKLKRLRGKTKHFF